MIPAELIGKKCSLRGEATLVFDWSKVPARQQTRFLSDLFDDHEEGAPEGLVPFALVGCEGDESKWKFTAEPPQFHRLLALDAKGAVVGWSVDGTVTTAKPRKVAASFAALKLAVAVEKPAPAPLKKGTVRNANSVAVSRALAGLTTAMFRLHCDRHPGFGLKPKDGKPWRAKAVKALDLLGRALEGDPRLATNARLGRLHASYATELAAIETDPGAYTRRISRHQYDEGFFERRIALEQYGIEEVYGHLKKAFKGEKP